MDGEGCLVRSTEVTYTGAHVDSKSKNLKVSAQCSQSAATSQIDYFTVRSSSQRPPRDDDLT